MLVNTKTIFEYSIKQKRAICAFNVSNLEMMQAVVECAKEENVPVIISASETAINYAGIENLVSLAKNLTKNADLPIALHLDHGSNVEICKKAIKSGFTSVMFDGSALDYAENVKLTKQVVDFAHKHNVTVEAELGKIMGVEDNIIHKNAILTNPKQAKDFVTKTNCDSLAISIGTAHGINKGLKQPKVYYDVINNVKKELGQNFPLVAHGSSSVPALLVKNINKFGGNITKSQGISTQDLAKISKSGINKINIDTDLRLAFTSGLREFLQTNPEVFDPRKILNSAKQAVKTQISSLINLISKK